MADQLNSKGHDLKVGQLDVLVAALYPIISNKIHSPFSSNWLPVRGLPASEKRTGTPD